MLSIKILKIKISLPSFDRLFTKKNRTKLKNQTAHEVPLITMKNERNRTNAFTRSYKPSKKERDVRNQTTPKASPDGK